MRFEPTDEQRQVLDAATSALITAGPGTGKTRTAIEKAILQLQQMSETSLEQVLFLSFSNAAVHRLADAANVHVPRKRKGRLRFMTYHALAAELLRHFGRFVGLPPRVKVMDRLEEMLISLEEGWANGEDHEEHLAQIAKKRGLIAFSKLIPLATTMLQDGRTLSRVVSRRYPLIIVDEFQDTSQQQWELLQRVGDASQVLTFGDPNQIIYGSLHAATEARLDQFRRWKHAVDITFSAGNFRFGSADILLLADCVLKGLPYTFKPKSGVQRLQTRHRNELRSKLAMLWMNIRKHAGDGATIAFLTPNNAIADEVATELRNPPASAQVAFPVFAHMTRDEAAHDSVLLCVSALRDLARHQDEHSVARAAVALEAMDGLWNTRKHVSAVSVARTAKLLQKQLTHGGRLADVMHCSLSAGVLNDVIPQFVEALATTAEFKGTAKRIRAHDKVSCEKVVPASQGMLFNSLRAARQPKGLYGDSFGQATTVVLNYHKAKGREFDYVVIVVDPRGESSKTPIEEARRLMYVCVTRAKRWLGILYFGRDTGRVLQPVLS